MHAVTAMLGASDEGGFLGLARVDLVTVGRLTQKLGLRKKTA